jgi:hypothetical protein
VNPLASELLSTILKDCKIRSKQVVRELTSKEFGGRDEDSLRNIRQFFSKQMPQLRQDTLEDYLSHRSSQIKVATLFGERENIEFRSEEQLSDVFKSKDRSGWNFFRQQFPDSCGILQISQPGFSGDQKQALLEIGQQQDWLWGAGICFLCEYEGGAWKIIKKVGTWVS